VTGRAWRARAGDALCVALAGVAVLDLAHLGLADRPVVVAAQLSLWVALLLRHVLRALLYAVPVIPVALGFLAPGTNDQTVTQLVAVMLTGFWLARRDSRSALAVSVLIVGSVLAMQLQSLPLDRTDVSDVLYVSAPALLAAAGGRRLAQRQRELAELEQLQARLEQEQSARAARALAAEQARISRELHDVVAQGAGAVVAQATAARLLLEQGRDDDARAALAAVESSARAGLADMRVLLGVLRAPVVPEQGGPA
jgi:signal transduction histidine kinase